jgi:hypothetical protein
LTHPSTRNAPDRLSRHQPQLIHRFYIDVVDNGTDTWPNGETFEAGADTALEGHVFR